MSALPAALYDASTPEPRGRQPRGAVKINNQVVSGWTAWTVTNTSYAEADTFSVQFSISALLEPNTAQFFSYTSTDTFVEIFGGDPSNPDAPDVNELTSFIYGRIDDMDFDLVNQTFSITGRDLTGAFIDKKIAENFTNQRASDIVQSLAKAHNVSYEVTPTKIRAGSYYDQNTVELQFGSEWDLLNKLALREGFVVYMKGQILYFGPDQTGRGSQLLINYQPPPNRGGYPIANATSINFSRSQTVVKGITVTVQSAGTTGKTIKKSYPTSTKAITPGRASPYGASTNYFYNMPAGTPPDKLLLRAQTLYNEIIAHAMKCSLTMPADETTNVQSTVRVRGTGLSFDQIYYPRSISRTLSMDEGFTMQIEGQSYSPNLTPAEPNDEPADPTPIMVTADKLPEVQDSPDSPPDETSE